MRLFGYLLKHRSHHLHYYVYRIQVTVVYTNQPCTFLLPSKEHKPTVCVHSMHVLRVHVCMSDVRIIIIS